MTPELGLIEGYYGIPWDWAARERVMRRLATVGYRFFMYAPKADAFLRRRWREIHSDTDLQALSTFSAACRDAGVRFGMGLSPFEVWQDFGVETKAALAGKLAFLDDLGVEDLGILFDDMRGDLPGLAESQVEIVHWIAGRTRASRIVFCPTYYSDDPALDMGFGVRPEGYLEALGAALDPRIEVFWTGEEVCSRAYGVRHLERVGEQLRRRPFLWDNYPVNDGPRMSPFLHLRAFTGRPAGIGPRLSAHAINPALQPELTLLPALTLPESYRLGDDYDYGAALAGAARDALGPDLGDLVRRHLTLLNDTGRDQMDPAVRTRLRARYSGIDHAAAREIVDWLDGKWVMTLDMMNGDH
ncbi:MAG: beta-N-acetylglucosaminidase domain-containing protein [Phenylobacterium sp.]